MRCILAKYSDGILNICIIYRTSILMEQAIQEQVQSDLNTRGLTI